MNIESKLITWLNKNLPEGWEAFGDIPEEKPDQFVIVERTGGPVDNVRIERPEITVSYYHKSSASTASDVSLEMDKKIRLEFVAEPNVSKVERNSLVRLDDMILKWPRYFAYYSFVIMV